MLFPAAPIAAIAAMLGFSSGDGDDDGLIGSTQELLLTFLLTFVGVVATVVISLYALTKVGFFREYFTFAADFARTVVSIFTFGLVKP